MIQLVKDTIDNQDIDSLIDWLKGYPHLTKGEVTVEFEKKWSIQAGVSHSIFVNSGSSAILLMLQALIESGKLSKGDKVVVPAVSWATDLAPVIQLGLEPILCDCNLDDLSIDIESFKEAILQEEPKVLILVTVLGLVPQMDIIKSICDENKVILLEDICEGLGSEFKDRKLGTWGLMSACSTYFGHHISTIEGGMITTNDNDLYNILKSIRSHGWDRDMDEPYQQKLREEFPCTPFESLYKFYYCGFNLRSTDLQAFIGVSQLDKLPEIIKKRHENYKLYDSLLDESLWRPNQPEPYCLVSNFAYPLICDKRNAIAKELSKNNIACRPLISGSMHKQPFWVKKAHKTFNLNNASKVNDVGMYIPNNHQLTPEEIELISSIVNSTVSNHGLKK